MPSKTSLPRLLIVEGDPVARLGLRAVLAAQAGTVCVVGEVGSLRAAEAFCAEAKVELILLDWDLDGGGGPSFLRWLRKVQPQAALLALFHRADGRAEQAALQAGAQGVLLREELATALLPAVAAALAGDYYLSPRASSTLAAATARHAHAEPPTATTALPPQQRRVFRLLGEGHAPRTISERLGIGVKTVQTHIDRMKKALGELSQSTLAQRAAQWLARKKNLPPAHNAKTRVGGAARGPRRRR
jgi:DNA-binding NarL/FixJ family response regulator